MGGAVDGGVVAGAVVGGGSVDGAAVDVAAAVVDGRPVVDVTSIELVVTSVGDTVSLVERDAEHAARAATDANAIRPGRCARTAPL